MTSKPLKKGFTTGTAAAGAARAALLYLITGKIIKNVDIRCLSGEKLSIAVHHLEIISENQAKCIIIKDAGDDPDVTHQAQIGANVTIHDFDNTRQSFPSQEFNAILKLKNISNRINITGGKGVGLVTKPGLEVLPGNPAINPGPCKMIKEAVEKALAQYGFSGAKIDVEIFVPDGEALAEKTLNDRLGILGGISILGTTGIVKPMSHDAYIATIQSAISVAEAMGERTLVFTTGRRSERFAMDLFPDFREESFVQIGDFFKASLKAASKNTCMNKIIITVFFGKAVKMAMGFPHTHAAKSELTMKTLAKWAQNITSDKTLSLKIAKANTARHAFDYIYPDYPELIAHVAKEIVASAKRFIMGKVQLRAVIFDFNGKQIFDTNNFI